MTTTTTTASVSTSAYVPDSTEMQFQVQQDILNQVKQQRLQFFSRQIAETQLNIKVYNALIEQYNRPEDISLRDVEFTKLQRYVTSYNTANAG